MQIYSKRPLELCCRVNNVSRSSSFRTIFSLAIILFQFSGCFLFSKKNDNTKESTKEIVQKRNGSISIDLFAARGFLGGSDFERYHLRDGLLWRECGSVAKPSFQSLAASSSRAKLENSNVENSDSVSHSPNQPELTTKEKKIDHLSDSNIDLIFNRSEKIIEKISSVKNDIQPPGSVFSIGSPGVFELSISAGSKKGRVVTSVDAVSEQNNALLAEVRELFTMLRGVGPTICSFTTFFGIERKPFSNTN